MNNNPIKNGTTALALIDGVGVVIVKRGEAGYVKNSSFISLQHAIDFVNGWNELHDITPAIREAILAGSMFGHEAPIAQPDKHAAATPYALPGEAPGAASLASTGTDKRKPN
ncbi:MAG: hypothetical protein ACYDHD_00155 [Vulcanimicrobiaceae bacterium]